MSRIERLEAVLRSWEAEFKARLRVDLPSVASGRDTVYFFNEQNNPFSLPKQQLSVRGGEAFEMAVQIMSLRKDLDTFGPSAADEFLETVAKHASNDPNRLGAQRLAAQLLANLEAIWSSEGAA
jgi:hypothetical protein